MRRIWDSVSKDLWVVLLDIIALNVSYFLALLVRFYVNGEFRVSVNYLIGDWARFAPFYTVLSIVNLLFSVCMVVCGDTPASMI